MGGLGRQAVQVCRVHALSRPVSPVLYPLGPETPEGSKGQCAPNTSGKPPAPPWAGETLCSGRQHGAPWKDRNQEPPRIREPSSGPLFLLPSRNLP